MLIEIIKKIFFSLLHLLFYFIIIIYDLFLKKKNFVFFVLTINILKSNKFLLKNYFRNILLIK